MRIRDRVEAESTGSAHCIRTLVELDLTDHQSGGAQELDAVGVLRSKALLLAKGCTNAPGPRPFPALSPTVTPPPALVSGCHKYPCAGTAYWQHPFSLGTAIG